MPPWFRKSRFKLDLQVLFRTEKQGGRNGQPKSKSWLNHKQKHNPPSLFLSKELHYLPPYFLYISSIPVPQTLREGRDFLSLYSQTFLLVHPITLEMEFKVCLVVLLLALAMVAAVESSKIQDASWGLKHRHDTNVGDIIGEENEMLLDSEASRRQLAQRGRFISYEALKKNNVPCGRRGNSYYNCNNRQQANPYNRGCSYITHCARHDWTRRRFSVQICAWTLVRPLLL